MSGSAVSIDLLRLCDDLFGGVTPAAIITSRTAASVSGDGLKLPNR